MSLHEIFDKAKPVLKKGGEILLQNTRRAAGFALKTVGACAKKEAQVLGDDLSTPERRREFLAYMGVAGGAALATAGGLRYGIEEKGLPLGEWSQEVEFSKSKPVELAYGELMSNWLNSFELVWGGLDKNQIVFVDQLGTVIGDPIQVESIRLSETEKIPPLNNNNGLNQAWLDWHRENLVKKYPTVFHKPGSFPALYTPRLPLQAEKPGTTVLDLTWNNAQKSVHYKRSSKDPGRKTTRLNFSRQVFAWSKVLPKDFQEIASLGIPSVESGFLDGVKSSAGAVGAFQMLDEAAIESGLKIGGSHTEKVNKPIQKKNKRGKKIWVDNFVDEQVKDPDERKFFVSAALGSMRYFENLYKELGKYQPLLEICSRFQLQPSEFLYPCMINAYHSGKGRIRKMLRWFNREFSAKDIERKIGKGPYGMDIFVFMTQNYRESGTDTGYGRDSWGYPFQVMAMANLMKGRIANPGFRVDPFGSEDAYDAPPELDEKITMKVSGQDKSGHALLSEAIPLGAGIAVGTTAALIYEARKNKQPMSRRQFHSSVRNAVLGAVTGVVGINSLTKEEPAIRPGTEELPLPEIMSPEKQKAESGTQSLAEKLLASNRLINNTKLRAVDLPRRQQPKTNEFIENANPQSFDDFTELRTAVGRGRLKPLDKKNSNYRLYKIGTQIKGSDGADAQDLLCHAYPHTEKLIRTIAREMNALLHQEAGLDPRYQVRLLVTSAVRPGVYNKRLRPKSSLKSAHQYGIAIDLANTRFDIIDTQTGASYTATEANNDPVNRKFRVTTFCRAALNRVIRKMHDEGEIIAMLEGGHIHFTDKHFRS